MLFLKASYWVYVYYFTKNLQTKEGPVSLLK